MEVEGEYPVANSLEAQKFRRTVGEDDTLVAWSVFQHGSDRLKKYCGKYMAHLESSRLIELYRFGYNLVIKAWILGMVLVYGNLSLFDTVFAAVEPPLDVRKCVVSNVDAVCMPRKFVHFLKKTTDKYGQEDIVEYGVSALFEGNKTEYFDDLLSAIKRGTFMSKNLENVAIRRAFLGGSGYNDVRILFTQRFFDHPSVFSEIYSDALYRAYNNGDQNKELFKWLLKRADCEDLKAVKMPLYKSFWRNFKFKQAVNDALQKVGSDTRLGIARQEGVPALKKALIDHLPEVLIKEIANYYFVW